MDVYYMTLDGRSDLDVFLDEWWNSDENDATYLQSEGGIYLMPYGHFSDTPRAKIGEKFSGSYRRHTFIQRDFELKGKIDGGGYLILDKSRKRCRHGNYSVDFPGALDKGVVVEAVTRELLFGN